MILYQVYVPVVAEDKPSFVNMNEQLTFTGSNQNKDLILYGRENDTRVNIFSSDLVDNKSGKVIKSSNVLFNVTSDHPVSILSLLLNANETTRVTVSIEKISPGFYSGKIFVASPNFISSVQISVVTESKIFDASVWIIFGIMASIVIWKGYTWIDLRRRYNAVEDSVIYTVAACRVYKDFFKNYPFAYNTTYMHLSRVMDSLEVSDIDNAEKRIALADQAFSGISSPGFLNLEPPNRPQPAVLNNLISQNTYGKFLTPPVAPGVGPVPTYGDIASQAITSSSTLFAILDEQIKQEMQQIKNKASSRKQRARDRKKLGQDRDPSLVPQVLTEPLGDIEDRIHGSNFSIWKYLNHDIVLKNMAFDVGAIFVGIIAGLATTLQQGYVGGLREIQNIDYLILFGIGLGIDNVKQIISKYVDK